MKIVKQTLKIVSLLVTILIPILGLRYTYLFLSKDNPWGIFTCIFSIIFIGAIVICSFEVDNFYLFNPILGKEIYHKCGNFYVDIKDSNYILYDDKIIYKDVIDKVSFFKINSEKDLTSHIKTILDNKYKEKLKLKEKKDFLYKSDGYVDQQLKRENILNKIL